MKTIITSYFDYQLYEKKGIPEFLEKIIPKLNSIKYKESDDIILKENQISKNSIIRINYLDKYSDDFQLIRDVISSFEFENFNFENNKFTLCLYKITTFKNTKKENFIEHLAHEIHHSYELFNIFKYTKKTEMNKDWKLNLKQQNFRGKNRIFDEFLHILYKSLSLEINANIVGLYFKIRKKNLINKNDILELIKNEILFIHIKTMENFDPEKFKKYMINNIGLDESQKIINDFNENEIDIYNFFSKWNKFFKKQSKKYNQKINRMIDLIINEKQNNSING